MSGDEVTRESPTTATVDVATRIWSGVVEGHTPPSSRVFSTETKNAGPPPPIAALEWHPFAIPVRKVFKAVAPDAEIACEAVAAIVDLLVVLTNRLVRLAQENAWNVVHRYTLPSAIQEYQMILEDPDNTDRDEFLETTRCVVTSRDIQTAVRQAMLGSLRMHAISQGTKTIRWVRMENLLSRRAFGEGFEPFDDKFESFPEETFAVWLETAMDYGFRPSVAATGYLCGVVTYIATEVCEVAHQTAGKQQGQYLAMQTLVSAKDIAAAIREDDELSSLFHSCAFLHGGEQQMHGVKQTQKVAVLAKSFAPPSVLTVCGFFMDGSFPRKLYSTVTPPVSEAIDRTGRTVNRDCYHPMEILQILHVLRFASRAGVKYLDPSLVENFELAKEIENLVCRVASEFACITNHLRCGRQSANEVDNRISEEAELDIATVGAARKVLGITVCGTGLVGQHPEPMRGCWWRALPKLIEPNSIWHSRIKLDRSVPATMRQAATLEQALLCLDRGVFFREEKGSEFHRLPLDRPVAAPLGPEGSIQHWEDATSATYQTAFKEYALPDSEENICLDRPHLLAAMCLLRGGQVLNMGPTVYADIPVQANGIWMSDEPQVQVADEALFLGFLLEAAQDLQLVAQLASVSLTELATCPKFELSVGLQQHVMDAATVAKATLDNTAAPPPQNRGGDEAHEVLDKTRLIRHVCVTLIQSCKDPSLIESIINALCDNLLLRETSHKGAISNRLSRHEGPIWQPRLFKFMFLQSLRDFQADAFVGTQAMQRMQAIVEMAVVQAFMIAHEKSLRVAKSLARISGEDRPGTDQVNTVPLSPDLVCEGICEVLKGRI